MAQYSENEILRLLSYPLSSVLAALGKRTDHKGYMFYSPFRSESAPSFHIDTRKNTWYDFGIAEGGGVIDLVCRIKECGKADALDYLAGMDPNFVHVSADIKPPSDSNERIPSSNIHIRNVSDRITRYVLVEYALAQRKIPIDILNRYCRQIEYTIGDRTGSVYYAIGFPNNSGGWVLRSSRTKICSCSDVSTMNRNGEICKDPSKGRAVVFEGFFDMLSWRAMYGSKSLNCDVCVLNSVANWKRAVGWLSSHKTVQLCLDNDDAGRRTVSQIAESVKKMNGNLEVWDMSASYARYKDVAQMQETLDVSRNRSRHIH